MATTLHVGIDIGRRAHAVQVLDATGHPVGPPRTVPNTPAAVADLIAHLAPLAADAAQVHIGLEATGLYWWHLYRALDAAPALAPHPVHLTLLNPKLIAGFRAAYATMNKTDPDDAFLIADRLRFGQGAGAPPPNPRYFPLQRLTRARYQLVHTLVRVKSQALTLLFLAASAYDTLEPFSDTFGATSRAVLTEFASLDEVAALPLAELVAFLDRHSHHRIPDPAATATVLQQVATDSFRLDPPAADAVRFALGQALEHIRFLTRQQAALDRQIAQALTAFPTTLATVPGLGPVFTAGLVAEIGDITRFPDDDALAKYAGLWWPRRQSGRFEASDRRLAKSGNAYLRYYLCEAVATLRMHNAVYRAYYDRKCKETPTHAHKRATVLTARKLVRLVDALLRTHQPYAGSGAVSPADRPRRP
jgi:transposase